MERDLSLFYTMHNRLLPFWRLSFKTIDIVSKKRGIEEEGAIRGIFVRAEVFLYFCLPENTINEYRRINRQICQAYT